MRGPTKKQEIANWWNEFAMTYGDTHGETKYSGEDLEMGTKEFFEEVDSRFYEGHYPFAHTDRPIFSRLFDYKKYKGQRALEIGCGMGTLLHQWVEQGTRITGIDISEAAVEQTKKRLEIYQLKGNVLRADAETLPFEDNAFDFVYSWGVLHHTPGTSLGIGEIWRVLRPGGEVGIMLYNKNSLDYYWRMYLIEGIVHLERMFLDGDVGLPSRYCDGGLTGGEGNPYTRVFTKAEVYSMLRGFEDIRVSTWSVDGILQDIFRPLYRFIPRYFRELCSGRWGWFLWITASKARAEPRL